MRESIGGVAWQRGQKTSKVRHRGLHDPSELGEKYLARLEFGELSDLLGWKELKSQKTTLDHERVMILGEVLQYFRCSCRVIVGERKTGGAKQEFVECVDVQFSSRKTSHAHLHDLELSPVLTKAAAQCLLILDRKTRIFGEEHGLCSLDTLLDVGDSLDLFWSWHVRLLKSDFRFSIHAGPETIKAPDMRRQELP